MPSRKSPLMFRIFVSRLPIANKTSTGKSYCCAASSKYGNQPFCFADSNCLVRSASVQLAIVHLLNMIKQNEVSSLFSESLRQIISVGAVLYIVLHKHNQVPLRRLLGLFFIGA